MITRLCKKAHVPSITRVDNKVKKRKIHNFDRKDENKPILIFGKRVSLGYDAQAIKRTEAPVPTSEAAKNIQISLAKSFHNTLSTDTVPTPEMERRVVIATFVSKYAITH